MQDLESIGADVAFALTVMLKQTSPQTHYLAVEGKEDYRYLQGHLSRDKVQIFITGSKTEVLKYCNLLQANHISNARGIVDRDLDDYLPVKFIYPSSLFVTQGYDLFSDIISVDPSLLSRALRNQNPSVVSRVERIRNEPIENIVRNLVLEVVRFRLVNELLDLGISFSHMAFMELMDSEFRPLPPRKVLEYFNSRRTATIDFDSLETELNLAVNSLPREIGICGGHDLVSASVAILKKGGCPNSSTHATISSVLTGHNCEKMMQMKIFKEISDWGQASSIRIFDCV